MTDLLRNYKDPIADLTSEIWIPRWVDQDISPSTVAAILQGGCASGAYMPAVTYSDSVETMQRHGDAEDGVLAYLEDILGELPPPPLDDSSWSGLAYHYVTHAVELWAASIEDDLRRILADKVAE